MPRSATLAVVPAVLGAAIAYSSFEDNLGVWCKICLYTAVAVIALAVVVITAALQRTDSGRPYVLVLAGLAILSSIAQLLTEAGTLSGDAVCTSANCADVQARGVTWQSVAVLITSVVVVALTLIPRPGMGGENVASP